MILGMVQRLRAGLEKSRARIGEMIDLAVGRGVFDAESADALEEALILGDVGAATASELVEGLKAWLREAGGGVTPETAKEAIATLIARRFPPASPIAKSEKPAVVIIVGVNGTGKTTTAAKLAAKARAAGEDVLLGAADTFRAAAADQLRVWGERVGVPVVSQQEGADPAAVAYDSVQSAIARNADRVIIDTAGRLHTKTNLMAELEKVLRVVRKLRNPEEILLVLDATTGQNGLLQVENFAKSLPLTGLVVTKLDGSAKAGVVVQAAERFHLPVLWVGVGETVDDLLPFDAEQFSRDLVG